jgi:quinoprotein glucose dehydrogenase
MAVAGLTVLFPWQLPPEDAHFGHELSPQRGTPYFILRDPIVDTHNQPCVAPPWGETVALNLNTGTLTWHTPLGTLVPGQHTGSPTYGGPITTVSGLVFVAATDDARLRALDAHTGAELWSAPLPASARATPMTFTLDRRQFVVIAAGGHGGLNGTRGDSLVAFTLPQQRSHP